MNTEEWKVEKYRTYGVNEILLEHVVKVLAFLSGNNNSFCLVSTRDLSFADENSTSSCFSAKFCDTVRLSYYHVIAKKLFSL